MRVLCAFCFYHTEVGEYDREIVCVKRGMSMPVYEDGTTEAMPEGGAVILNSLTRAAA